jgi:hypothetical protein
MLLHADKIPGPTRLAKAKLVVWNQGHSAECGCDIYDVGEHAVSTAFYIVLEREIPGFDPFVNGKALARAQSLLDVLAQKTGAPRLMDFFSASPAGLAEFAERHAVAIEGNADEQWFSADDGLASVRSIRDAAKAEGGHDWEKIVSDLEAFERILQRAKEAACAGTWRWITETSKAVVKGESRGAGGEFGRGRCGASRLFARR